MDNKTKNLTDRQKRVKNKRSIWNFVYFSLVLMNAATILFSLGFSFMTEKVFLNFQQQQIALAGQAMAAMDKKFAVFNREILVLNSRVRDIQKSHLREQEQLLQKVLRYGYVTFFFIFLALVFVTFYGRKLSLEMWDTEEDRERFLAEIKRQEDRLLQFSRAVEYSPVSIVITDIKGTIEYVNPKFTEVTGYSVSEAVGQNPRVLKSGQQSPEFYRDLWETLKSGNVWYGEFHNKKKNGELYWESASISPLKNEQGHITHFVAVKEDITQRKHSEEEIRLLNSYQKILLDNAGYSIIATDANGTIKVFNPAAERMLGYKAQDVIGKMTPVAIHDQDEVTRRAKEFSSELRSEIAPGFDVFVARSKDNLPNTYEWTYIRKDGSRFPVLLTVSALRDEHGNIFGYLGVASDISHLKEIQNNLERTTQRFELAKRSAQIGVWDWDVVNNVLSWDERMYKLYGVKPDGFTSAYQDWQASLEPNDRERVDQEIRQALAGEKEFDTEFKVMWPDQSLHYIKAYGAVTRDHQGQALRMTGINWDITAQKEAETKVSEAVRVKSEFTSMVSHELRTPLTVIKESVSIVHDGTAGSLNKDQQDFLDTAKRNVDRLGRLINDVLDYQKLESQHVPFRMVLQDINEVVGEVGRSFELPLKNKGLGLVIELQSNLPQIVFDKDQITQVLTNFINNAMKFSEKGNISLITKQVGDNSIKVSIQDQGIGIKKEDFEKLFRSFSQISTGAGRRTGGTGLGLVLCKKIIESHQGKVGVESVAGQGTTFYFFLPIRDRRG